MRQSRLEFQEGTSDKVYEVDLCEAGEGEFLVNFRYGRRGSNLREGTKTVFPVTLAQAESLFEKLVSEKTRKGYHVSGEAGLPSPTPAQPSATKVESSDPRHILIRQRLSDAARDRASVPQSWKLSRMIWRAGLWKMAETADSIAAIVPQLENEMECWNAAWALGRCGQEKHATALALLAEQAPIYPSLYNILPEASLALGQALSTEVDLPPALAEFWQNAKDEWQGVEEARTLFRESCEKWLRGKLLTESQQRELIFRSAEHSWLREFIYQLLRTLPIQEGTAAFFRQALKSAEFRLDAELYGQAMRRFESTRGTPVPYYVPHNYKAPAASSTTLRYFRRRGMNFLHWAGESNEPALFIALATGLLAAFDDEMKEATPNSFISYRWDPNTRRSSYTTIHHPQFAECLSFLWILRGGAKAVELNERKSGWRFQEGQSGGPISREEPFPELWNQAPDAIIHLLRVSRCTLVQEFALRIWAANPTFINEADNAMVLDLLSSWFEPTRQLGFAIAKEKWDSSHPDEGLLLAMLSADLPEARTLACEWLKELPNSWFDNSDFLAAVAFLPYEEGRVATREALRSVTLPTESKQSLAAKIISGLLALDEEDESAGPAVDWLWQVTAAETTALPDEHLLALARHPAESTQLLAVRILLNRDDTASLSEELLLSAVLSDHTPVRKQGMVLLAQLPDQQLVKRTETLAACAVSPHPELREAAAPLLARINQQDPAAARKLVEQWYPLLFRQEAFEGLHASLYETLTQSFPDKLDVIPTGQFPKMLESSHPHGQMLGFVLLQREVSNPSQENLATWANHSLVTLREWSRERFDTTELRHDPRAALQLLESPYSDTRDWAFHFCREEIQDGDWTPESLVAICDSTRSEVRVFGREQVTRLFQEEDGPLYLARLSQHPSTEIQLFATNYLERYGSGHSERIAELDLYFRTVLSRIGAGQIAKKRVLTFLEKEALAHETTARQVSALLARQSGTVAIQDKAEMIRILRAIQLRWPELESPLNLKPVEVYQAT